MLQLKRKNIKSKNSKLEAKYDTIAERCGTSSKRALLAARKKEGFQLAQLTATPEVWLHSEQRRVP